MAFGLRIGGSQHKVGTKKRFYLLTIVSFGTLIVLTSLFFVILGQQRSLMREIEGAHFDTTNALTAQLTELSGNHVRLVDLVNTPDERRDKKAVKSVSERFLRNVNRLKAELGRARTHFTANPRQRISYERLTENLKAYYAQAETVLRVAPSDAAAAERALRRANRHYRRISEEFELLISGSTDSAKSAITAALAAFDRQTYKFAGGAAAIVILLAILTLVMLRAVLRDISGIAGAMSALTTGRTDFHIPGLERHDEIGEMARATAVFRSNLEQLEAMSQLEAVAKKLEAEVAALVEQKAAYEQQVNELSASAAGLTEERDAAAAANRAKSELLAAISYDIRTPMNGLMGMAGLVLDGKLSDDQRENVEAIRQSGDALLAVVNDLLDYAKLDAGQVELERVEFDIMPLIERLPRMAWSQVHAIEAKLMFSIGQEVPQFFVGDAARLAQAIAGLLVTVARLSASGIISLDISVEGDEGPDVVLCFDVVDHADNNAGSGGAEMVARKWDRATAEGHTRLLPLAVCEQIVELMDGAIDYERQSDGSEHYRMTVRLGVSETATEDWRAPAGQLFNRRALVVAASNAERTVISRQLEFWGMAVEQAADGRAALSRLARAESQDLQYEIVLVDTVLPDMQGIAFIRAMRSSAGTDGVRVVLLRWSGEGPARDSFSALRIASDISEPITPPKLLGGVVAAFNSTFSADLEADEEAEAEAEEPPETDEPAAAEEPPERSDSAPEKRRILLADDNQMNQKVVTAMLKETAHTIDVVVNGRDAVEAVQKTPYDLVLMDIQMPEMDGVQATLAIRALPGDAANVPIIALTANAMEGDRDKYLASGMDDYIPKPIDRNLLIETIGRRFRGRNEAPAAEEAAGEEVVEEAQQAPETEPESDSQDQETLNTA